MILIKLIWCIIHFNISESRIYLWGSILFDKVEYQILKSAFNLVKQQENTLNELNSYVGSKGLGIEGWFLVEILTNSSFKNWGVEKVRSPADLRVKNKKVELKCITDSNFYVCRGYWEKKTNENNGIADFVLFLSNYDDKVHNKIISDIKRGYEIQYNNINDNWIIGMFKK